ncbi:MAG: X-Pro dipeptidyl-peptidase-like protein [Acidimicrobiales bacterium]|nr:X-Pro dipeptidyl-peptidase-like protein [Acidimicrobiales bacterium]
MGEVERDIRVVTADGVELSTDVHHPEGDGPFPTLLQRTCYGKELFADVAEVSRYVERGYRVVFQDCRGSGRSTGELDLFAEAPDGRATGDWIAAQPWFDGQLGTFGASYMTFTQWALASTRPPYLKAMAVALMGAEWRAGWYPGGSFALDVALSSSSLQVHGIASASPEHQAAIEAGFAHLPLEEADVIAVGERVPWFQAWLAHADPADPYWGPLDFTGALDLGLPVLLVDGWYDYQLPHMVRDLSILHRKGGPTRLVIGPWVHAGVDPEVMFQETVRWFDRHLKGEESVDTGAPTSVFVMPEGGWRDLSGWPPAHEPERWWLQPGGALARHPASESDATPYTYDPADPTPSFGGAGLRPDHAGPVDNRELEARPDVLTFTTDVLAEQLEVVGPVAAELFLSSSVEDLDVFVRLCDVFPDGRSINVCDGIRRLHPTDLHRTANGTFAVHLQLWPTAYQFDAGHRMRLQVSGGAHPLYARNLCSGEPLGSAQKVVVAQNAVHHDPAHPSALLLPG